MNETIMSLLLAGLAALVTLALRLLRGRLSAEAKSILLGLVAEAEAYFGSGTGKIKLSAVLGRLYATMPTLFAVLFREKTVTDWVEEAVYVLRADMPDPSLPEKGEGEKGEGFSPNEAPADAGGAA